jgi:signal transduction histidine kinase/uncharacterized protein YkuJ
METEIIKLNKKYQTLFENAPIVICEADFSEAKKVFDELKEQGVTNFKKYFDDCPHMVCQIYFKKTLITSNPATILQKEAPNSTDLPMPRPPYDISFSALMENECQKCGKYWESIRENLVGLAEGKVIIDGERHSVTASGKQKIVWQRLLVAPGHEGTLSKVFLYYIDLTEIKEKENQLRKYQHNLERMVIDRTAKLEESQKREHELYERELELRKELEIKYKQQEIFIHRLAHELKSPLFPMVSASEMMLNHTDSPELKSMALNINRGANALANSVNDLIDVLRGEIGVLQLKIREFDIKETIIEVAEFMKYEADRHKQKLTLDLPDGYWILSGDCKRIKQVLINLLENAFRYTSSEGSINLQLLNAESAIIIKVVDNGPCIPPDSIHTIFEPYYSTENRIKQTGGLGLGLPLAKMIVELHDGSIWAKNLNTRGVEIGFMIPNKRNGKK